MYTNKILTNKIFKHTHVLTNYTKLKTWFRRLLRHLATKWIRLILWLLGPTWATGRPHSKNETIWINSAIWRQVTYITNRKATTVFHQQHSKLFDCHVPITTNDL